MLARKLVALDEELRPAVRHPLRVAVWPLKEDSQVAAQLDGARQGAALKAEVRVRANRLARSPLNPGLGHHAGNYEK